MTHVPSAEFPAPPGSGAMFDAIAERYDLMNRLLSFGIDQRWRKKTVAALGATAHGKVLDLATGTADLAILIAKQSPTAEVTGVDPSPRMLEVGRLKVERLGLGERIHLQEGAADHLPFSDSSFDAATIAFGIRNVPDRKGGLQELRRVTRPGGRVAILELSEPRRGWLGPAARFHVHTVVPWLGSLLSGAKQYRYLQRSIAQFPPAEEFAQTMREAGLDVLSVTALTFGVAHLYVASPRP